MSNERIALQLSIFTVVYNLLEGVVSIVFSATDDSVALLGFGADSFIESLSGAVMIWRFWNPEGAEQRETGAARLVGGSLLVLAAYVIYNALTSLYEPNVTEPSRAALIIAALSLVVMPVLYIFKRRTAQRLGSRSLLSDSKQTLACITLSMALLIGAGLRWAGYPNADPIAGLVIAAYLLREGWLALTTHEMCAC